MEIRFTGHALASMNRRGLSRKTVRTVIKEPDARLQRKGMREIRQRLVPMGPEGKLYLVRVVLDFTLDEVVVVTAYRTSRVEKYRGGP
jgi:Domain of unknown function (DUF4258)